ncbi:hypothetical protein Rrhod_3531 [Rhodococcus rhodnii LMG 5362]|uniref:Uncharacterized protein n=1 Tax=Rhodococcus rhodnii LMG 5362 TaxID=1273125 RepID=R7WIS1_9NOCA|nr:hypothetical protein Rrhod_3531 [Rhodococcus rhodnii LMG 5362]
MMDVLASAEASAAPRTHGALAGSTLAVPASRAAEAAVLMCSGRLPDEA